MLRWKLISYPVCRALIYFIWWPCYTIVSVVVPNCSSSTVFIKKWNKQSIYGIRSWHCFMLWGLAVYDEFGEFTYKFCTCIWNAICIYCEWYLVSLFVESVIKLRPVPFIIIWSNLWKRLYKEKILIIILIKQL